MVAYDDVDERASRRCRPGRGGVSRPRARRRVDGPRRSRAALPRDVVPDLRIRAVGHPLVFGTRPAAVLGALSRPRRSVRRLRRGCARRRRGRVVVRPDRAGGIRYLVVACVGDVRVGPRRTRDRGPVRLSLRRSERPCRPGAVAESACGSDARQCDRGGAVQPGRGGVAHRHHGCGGARERWRPATALPRGDRRSGDAPRCPDPHVSEPGHVPVQVERPGRDADRRRVVRLRRAASLRGHPGGGVRIRRGGRGRFPGSERAGCEL